MLAEFPENGKKKNILINTREVNLFLKKINEKDTFLERNPNVAVVVCLKQIRRFHV